MSLSTAHLSALVRADDFTIWHYDCGGNAATDPSALFGEAAGLLRRGDLIFCKTGPEGGRRSELLLVTRAAPDSLALDLIAGDMAPRLGALADVVIGSATADQVLGFNGEVWTNLDNPGRSGDAHAGARGNPHETTAADIAAVALAEKGQPNGVAALDGEGKVPAEQLPSALLADHVASVFGRSGAVIATDGDYTADQITDTATRVLMRAEERLKLAALAADAAPNPPAMADAEVIAGSDRTPKTPTAAQLRLAAETWAPAPGSGGYKAPLASYAALTALAKPEATEVRLVTANGGGEWEWRPTSTAAPNGGTILAADAGGAGRWHRIGVGSDIDARWFGCVCDGVTDDTEALLKARDYARSWPNGPATLFIPGDIRLATCDLTGISLIAAGWVRTDVGVTLTVGTGSEESKPVAVEIHRVSDGSPTLTARATPQVRIVGRGSRFRLEAGYVQIWSDGSSSDRFAAASNIIDVYACYLFEIIDINSGRNYANIITGSISNIRVDGTYPANNNKFYGAVEGIGGDNATIYFGNALNNAIYSRVENVATFTFTSQAYGNRIIKEQEASRKPDREFRKIADTVKDDGWMNCIAREHAALMNVTPVLASPRASAAANWTVLASRMVAVEPGDVILVYCDVSSVWRPKIDVLDGNKALLTANALDHFNADPVFGWANNGGAIEMGTTLTAGFAQVLQIKPAADQVRYLKFHARVAGSGPYTTQSGMSFAIARAPQAGPVLSGDAFFPVLGALPVASTSVTTVARTIEVFDATGASIGYVPVYRTRA